MILEKYLPKCDCFQDEDVAPEMIGKSVTLGQALARAMMDEIKESGICEKARQHVMDDAVMAMVVAVAVQGTIIEVGSEDAERETMRVLIGLEVRLTEKVQYLYAETRKHQAAGTLPRMNGRGETIA